MEIKENKIVVGRINFAPNSIPNDIIKRLEEFSIGNFHQAQYTIQQVQNIGNASVVEIECLGCTKCNGKKILVFDCHFEEVINKNKGLIDPHFSNDPDIISPVARFAPTKMSLAIKLAKLI